MKKGKLNNPSASRKEMFSHGERAALSGFTMHPPGVFVDHEAWALGWRKGKSRRNKLLEKMECIEISGRIAYPTLNNKHIAVWRDEQKGVDYETADSARTGLEKTAKADQQLEEYLLSIKVFWLKRSDHAV